MVCEQRFGLVLVCIKLNKVLVRIGKGVRMDDLEKEEAALDCVCLTAYLRGVLPIALMMPVDSR